MGQGEQGRWEEWVGKGEQGRWEECEEGGKGSRVGGSREEGSGGLRWSEIAAARVTCSTGTVVAYTA